jgi:hypothetical protein
MLVDDICKLLCNEDKLKLLQNLFEKIFNLSLESRSPEYIKTYILLNKYFMIVFNRLFTRLPDLVENLKLNFLINESIKKNWQIIKDIITLNTESKDTIDSYIKVFKDYLSSYTDLYDRNNKNKKPDLLITNFLLSVLEYLNKYLLLDEKSNLSSSKIFKIAQQIGDNNEIRQRIDILFDYIIKIVETSEPPTTLSNVLEVILWILSEFTDKKEYRRDKVLPVIINFMNNKPKLRLSVTFKSLM